MPVQFISTKLATDWDAQDKWWVKLLDIALFFVPKANPGYREQMHLIDRWLVEFEDDGNPWREIGLTTDDQSAVAGPSERDYGFWCDTNMTYKDFVGENISREEFEAFWEQSKGFRGEA